MNSQKGQSYKLGRSELQAPEVPVKHYALLDNGGRQPRRPSRVPITVALVLAGLLAGWVGGKFLPGVFQHSKPPTDVPAEEIAAPPQPGSRPSATVVVSGGKSLRPRDQQPDSQPGSADPQPKDTRADKAVDE